MFLSPVDRENNPDRKAWENYTIYDNGKYYAFFGIVNGKGGPREERVVSLDIAESEDGVHWEFIGRDLVPTPGGHAGFGVIRIGDFIYYLPTCTNKEKGIHFKVYRSKDLLEWEHLGDRYDVVPDPAYYSRRWDEVCVLREKEDGRDVYLGYISAEAREDVAPPSLGMVKSYDGVEWEVLPPPKIEWGEVPAQHMEVNFCERIGDRYYLSISGRLYMDSYGYSLYTFVGDSPYGPFTPDLTRFRLSGTSRYDTTWLGHTLKTPDGFLVALWLSYQQGHEIPSNNFAIGTLKKLVCEDGHLRLRYWEQNDSAKGAEIKPAPEKFTMVHPAETVKSERDSLVAGDGRLEISASRDGAIVLSGHRFERSTGLFLEGYLTVWENRGNIATHQHAAGAGIFIESAPGEGRAIIPDTLGVTRTGSVKYADHHITDYDIYASAGKDLVRGRSGLLQGILAFECEDTVGPFGHAAYCGIRHDRTHHFRFIARGDFFEFFIDDYYVQTFRMPDPFSGRIGFLVMDGRCRIDDLKMWELDLEEP